MKLDPKKDFEPASSSATPGTRWANRFSEWNARHPILAVLLVSLLAVVVNCHPVIFCGRSFVSPVSARSEVYEWWPSLPGMDRAGNYAHIPQHGSDTGAIMWWGVPVGFIESRSVLEHGELPLWNRYGHAGDTLMGQAISMLGDPLQWIVILGRGSAEAWDVKFIVAKYLFCAGFGLLMLRRFGSRPFSLIYAAMAAYCGAFFLIDNHPVFFVFCYTPWIFLSALEWLDLQSRRHVWWGLVWLLANFGCFNGGHLESAVVLIGGLNLAALVYALARHRHAAEWTRVIGRMGLGTILFMGLTAPVWMSFLVALEGAYSLHSAVEVLQLPPAALAGVFDDFFSLLGVKSDLYAAIAPGTSLLVMVGCILSALRWRQLKGDIFFWVNSGAILLWGGFVFGWIPIPVIAAIPFLNRVGHVYSDFSYLLVIHLTIQSAFGFKYLAQENSFRRAAVDLLWVGLIFGAMVLAYCVGIHHQPMPRGYFLCVGAGAFGAPLLFAYLKSGSRPISAAGWLGILVLGFIPHFRFAFYTFGDQRQLMIPGPREVLDYPSRSVDKIKADPAGPFRVVGLGWNFEGDYAAAYGIEDIRSCAPLSNDEYIQLIRRFPGVVFGGLGGWGIVILDPVRAQPLLNLLNVKYLLGDPRVAVGIPNGVDFRIAGRDDFMVLENPEAWPRAFFADKIAVNFSNVEFVAQLQENSREPFVSLSADEIAAHPGLRSLEDTKQATVVPATDYRLLPNSTAFDVHAPSAGVVCLTEGQAKDFTVTANHEPGEVLTVNRAFKGVYLDKPGDYHIEFIYRPRHWRLACTLFWISLAGVVVLAAGAMRSRTRRENLTA